MKIGFTTGEQEPVTIEWKNENGLRVASVTIYPDGLIEYRDSVKLSDICIENLGTKNLQVIFDGMKITR